MTFLYYKCMGFVGNVQMLLFKVLLIISQISFAAKCVCDLTLFKFLFTTHTELEQH